MFAKKIIFFLVSKIIFEARQSIFYSLILIYVWL